MTGFHPDLAARAVPRYTSYPTADRFTDAVGAAEQRAALGAIAPGAPVSFYVHVPYCHEICWYCGCNTGVIGRQDRLDAYVAALEAEIDSVADLLAGRMAALHFGGGTPNALAPDVLAGLIARLEDRFGRAPGAPVSIELDPRHCDRATLPRLAEAGVSRISLGVQTFATAVQWRINRVQPYEQVAGVVTAARDAGIEAVNFDLLYGLPGQTLADIADTVDLCLALAPDRIAAFGYAHMPRAMPRQRMIEAGTLPDQAQRWEQSLDIYRRLTGAGYQAIGFDHFALPDDSLARAARGGRLRRNFQGFTDEACDVIVGFGASAISQFPGLMVQNEKHVGRYRQCVQAGSLAGVRGVERDAESWARWRVIEGLLCGRTADPAGLAGLDTGWQPAIAAFAARGLVRAEASGLRITPEGLPYARLVAACFDPRFAPQLAA